MKICTITNPPCKVLSPAMQTHNMVTLTLSQYDRKKIALVRGRGN